MKSGLSMSNGYDRTLELPLKNLVRDVTAVKTLSGVVRVPLPSKVESLRFESPAPGAVVKSETMEVKLLGFTKSQLVVKGKSYPNAKLRVEYKGVHPERVRALAYDSQKSLLAVSGNSWSGSDAGGTAEFSVQGEPAVVVLKVISSVDSVEYEFAFNELPLTGAAGMPEKVVPATFPGHDVPVTVEFVRITAPQFPAKAQYRVVNHSDKDVRLLDLKLTYLDAAGRDAKGWPSVTYSGPTPPPQNHKGPAIVVGKRGAAVVEIEAPFLPDNAKAVRAGINTVVFTDATTRGATPLEK